jgi:hypothetical protein
MHSLNLICTYFLREYRSQIFCTSSQFKVQYSEEKLINVIINVFYKSGEWKVIDFQTKSRNSVHEEEHNLFTHMTSDGLTPKREYMNRHD